MNTLTLVQGLMDQKSDSELDIGLEKVWDGVWSDTSNNKYARLRQFKTVDKMKNLTQLGVNFRNKHVIDIGCGDGTTLSYLQKRFNITGLGLDISKEVVYRLRASRENKKLSFVIGDHRDLGWIERNQFDLAFSFGVIEHFDEYALALAEARRVLKPGGRMILIQPHLLSFGVLQKYYLKTIGKWRFGKQRDFSCFYYYMLLRQVGFQRIIYKTYPPYSDMWLTRILDRIVMKLIPFWGHYLYLVAEK